MTDQTTRKLPPNAEGPTGYLSYPDHFGYLVTPTYEPKARGPTDPANTSLPHPFVVAILGAGKGIGASIATAYAQAGASGISISSRTLADLALVKAEILKLNPQCQVICNEVDIANEATVIAQAASVQATFGRLDVVVINAGTSPRLLVDAAGQKRFPKGTIEQSSDDYLRVWNINVTGSYFAQKAFLPLLRDTKDGAQALIVTSSSASHHTASERSPLVYNLSKFTLNRLVESIHTSYHKDGVVAYALHPGATPTPLNSEYPPEWDASECSTTSSA